MNEYHGWIFLLCCVVLAVVPPYFVWNKVYNDGVFGRIGLLGISFFAFLFLFAALDEQDHRLTFITFGFVASVALFLVWHLIRFHRRIDKSKNPDRRTNPDRRFVP